MVRHDKGEANTSPFSIIPNKDARVMAKDVVRVSGRIVAMPRRSQLHNPTPEMKEKLEKFYKYLQAGNFIETALATAKIERTSYHYWMQRAKEDAKWWSEEVAELQRRGIDEDLPKSVYQLFSDKVEECIATAELQDVNNLRKAADAGSVNATIFRLQHRSPERWAPKPPPTPTPAVAAAQAAAQANVTVNVNVDPNLTVRNLLAADPNLCDLLSLLAERAELVHVPIPDAGDRERGDVIVAELGPANPSDVPEERGLASGPLGLRG